MSYFLTRDGIGVVVNGERIDFPRGSAGYRVVSTQLAEHAADRNINMLELYSYQQLRLREERHRRWQAHYQQQLDYQQQQQNQNWIYWGYEEPQQYVPQQYGVPQYDSHQYAPHQYAPVQYDPLQYAPQQYYPQGNEQQQGEQQQAEQQQEEDPQNEEDLVQGRIVTQYGGGRKRRSVTPVEEPRPKSPRIGSQTSPDHQAPDEEEDDPEIEIYKIEYGLSDLLTNEMVDRANRHLKIFGSPNFRRVNMERMSLPILKIKFVDVLDGDIPIFNIIGETLTTFLTAMVHKAGGDMETTELAVGLTHPGLAESRGLWHRRTGEMINGYIIQNELARIIQSNEKVRIDEAMSFELHVFKNVDMAGGCVKTINGSSSGRMYFDKNAGAMAFVRGEGKCLLKSIILGRIHYEDHMAKPGTPEKEAASKKWKTTRRYQDYAMARLLATLETEFKMPPNKNEHSLNDLEYIAGCDQSWKYEVYVRENGDIKFRLFKVFNENATKVIRIGYKDNHFDLLKLSTTVIDTMFCKKCQKNHRHTNHARYCKAVCNNCGQQGCEPDGTITECFDCHKYFKSTKCLERHSKPAGNHAKSYCEMYNRCERCDSLFTVDPEKDHICGATYCGRCREPQLQQHNCCHNPPSDKKKAKRIKDNAKWRVVAYDFETIVKEDDNGILKNTAQHEVNVACWRSFCESCILKDDCDKCVKDGEISYLNVKDDETVIGKFTDMLLHDKIYDKSIVVAHNGGRYDHQFIMAEIYKKHYKDIDITAKGKNILGATVKGHYPKNGGTHRNTLFFKDSYNFLTMSLASMPKAYGLTEMKKGIFPYAFNMKKNYGKKLDKLPSLKYYCVDELSPEKAEEVRKYHEEHINDGFDFDQEIISYAKEDVRILVGALKSYIGTCIKEMHGENPLQVALTTAGFVKSMLQNFFIESGDLGYIPERGFPGVNQSAIAMKWILWKEKQDGIKLKHKLRGGEAVIGGTHVDAINEATGEIFEFHGCVFHGCPKCTKSLEVSRHSPPSTNEDLYDKTMRRTQKLRDLGHKVTEIWEHEVKDELKTNPVMRKFFENCRHSSHFEPRSGMLGGRTQPYRMITEAKPGQRIRMLDFCSLYPSVNVRVPYPRGQPTIHRGDVPDIDDSGKLPYRGIYFVDVLPPVNLKIPVLPYNHDKKLLFPLCRTCCELSNMRGKCTHNKVSERVITGGFYSEELQKALDRGYKILRYHEIWSWDDWMEGGYFSKFIKPLLTLKHQASGFPDHVKTEQEKDDYIEFLEKADGVQLKKDLMIRNEPLRSVAKTNMNSCWGKFCENPRQQELKLFASSDVIGQRNFKDETGYRLSLINDLDGVTMLGRQKMEDYLDSKPFASLVIGIITTSMARLELLEALERAGADRIIYCDTDSIDFLEEDGEDLMGDLVGCGLGKLEDEVPEGSTVEKIVAIAPKTYACYIKDKDGNSKFIVKSKGFAVNETSKITINPDTYEKMAIAYMKDDIIDPVTATQFGMGKELFKGVHSTAIDKMLRPSMDKLHLNPDGTTRPYGFMENPVNIVNDYDYYMPSTVFAALPTLDCTTQFAQK